MILSQKLFFMAHQVLFREGIGQKLLRDQFPFPSESFLTNINGMFVQE